MSTPIFDRRRLLFGGSVAAGAAFLPGCKHGEDPFALEKPAVPGAGTWARGEEKSIATSCGQCPAACGVRVRVVEGRAVKVEGNSSSPINEGGIGPRGLCGPQVLYDPDRIRTPLRRGSDGKLTQATWDEALSAISSELARVRAAGAAQRVGILCGLERGMTRELLQRFAHAYGTPNVYSGFRSGAAPTALASGLMQGIEELPAYDWGRARYVLSFGAGLLDACHLVAFARAQVRGRQSLTRGRLKIVHVGPARASTGHAADEWHTIRTGTHGAFALGLAHVLVRDGLHAKEFVAERTFGFESWTDDVGRKHRGFRELLETYPPEHVAEICGVGAKQIERLAAELAASSPAFAWAASDELESSNGLWTAMAVHALNALLGAIDQPGGLLVQRAAPLADWPELELDEFATKSLANAPLGSAASTQIPLGGVPLAALREALLQAPAPPLDVLLLHHSNPLYARAQNRRWREALARIPLIVSFSPFLDETSAQLAHWVLPDDSYLERFEDAAPAPSVGRAVFGLRQPVVERLYDTRSSADVILQLAAALSSPLAEALPWKEFKDAVKQRIVGLHKAQRGSIVEEKSSTFVKKLYESGSWSDQPYEFGHWNETLLNQSGKFEFFSQRMLQLLDERARQAGVPAADLPAHLGFQGDLDSLCMPHFEELVWQGDPAQFPLRLIAYRPHTYAEGSGANLPWLRELDKRPASIRNHSEVELHPRTAESLSLARGELVAIESPVGRIECVVNPTHGVEPGVARIAQGGGHTELGRFARGIGANVMDLVVGAPGNPLVGFDNLCDTRVSVKKLV